MTALTIALDHLAQVPLRMNRKIVIWVILDNGVEHLFGTG